MTETIVVHKGHGLPYSKGLMAQALSATALSQERAFELARLIECKLGERGEAEIDVGALHSLAEEVLLAEEGQTAASRYRRWRRLDRLDRPLVVLIGGTTGVGKSTLASMLGARLGVNRVIPTDVIRQVLRAFFTPEAMATVHHSAFEAGGIPGYRDQAERVGTGIAAIVERAANEGKPVVVEGVHVVPGGVHPRVRESCVLVEALVIVDDPDLHRGALLPAARHTPGRALPRALRGHPRAPGPPLGAGALGERRDHRQRERRRSARAADGARSRRRQGRRVRPAPFRGRLPTR